MCSFKISWLILKLYFSLNKKKYIITQTKWIITIQAEEIFSERQVS